VYTTAVNADDVQFAVDIESDRIGIVTIETLIKRELENTIRGPFSDFTEELIVTFEEQLTVVSDLILEKAKLWTIKFELFVPNCPGPIQITWAIAAPTFSGLSTALLHSLRFVSEHFWLLTRENCGASRACLIAGKIAAATKFVIVSVPKRTELAYPAVPEEAENTGIFRNEIFARPREDCDLQ
jgi:hypothetical protein